jgi:hypothetical protein
MGVSACCVFGLAHYAGAASPPPDNTGRIQADTQPKVFPRPTDGPRRQAPAMADPGCIVSRCQLEIHRKISYHCEIVNIS